MAKFQSGGPLNNFLDSCGIIEPRKLHENLIVSEAMLLNGWLGYSQSIDATPDSVNGLLDRPLSDGISGCRLQDYIVRTLRSLDHIVIPQPIGDNAPELASLIKRNAFSHDQFGLVLFVRLADVCKRRVGLFQLLLKELDRMVGLGTDRFIHNDLKDEISPAFQVKTKVDAAKECFFGCISTQALGNAKDSVKKEDQDNEDRKSTRLNSSH